MSKELSIANKINKELYGRGIPARAKSDRTENDEIRKLLEKYYPEAKQKVKDRIALIVKPTKEDLPDLAWGIIEPRLKSKHWIFSSAYNRTRVTSKRDGHAKSTKDARRRLRIATGVEGWTAHDLRRTFRTLLAREGVQPHIAERVVGHVQGGVESIYDRHSYLKEKKEALRKVETAVRKIVGLDITESKTSSNF